MNAARRTSPELDNPVRVAADGCGGVVYVVTLPPEALPPVRKRDIELAWDAAHGAARAGLWGTPRGFRFLRPGGTPTELILAESSASCWADAVDRSVGLGHPYGLSLCLRLLALVDLLARARWTAGFYRMRHGSAEFHPALLRLAAVAPLTPGAGFDDAQFRAQLRPAALAAPAAPDRPTMPARPCPPDHARLTGATR